MLWQEQYQAASINFPQTSTNTELVPFIIKEENEHFLYTDSRKLQIPYFDILSFDLYFIIEHSETSNSRPSISSDTISEKQYQEYNVSVSQTEHETILHDS